MRIVLDTNVLVSALLTPHGPPGQILQLALAGKVVLCHDGRIMSEYRDVLRRPKFPFDPENVDELLSYLESVGESVSPEPLRQHLPDRDDESFLEVAVAAAAGYLVTGNVRHFPARLRAGVTVVSPAEFLQALSGAV